MTGALATGSAALAAPRMSAADRAAIGELVDRFVKEAVRREDLAAAWKLAGPELRAGTTYRAWVNGTGVTAPYFPARGSDFRHAWTGHLVAPGHAVLSVILIPRPGSAFEETAATVDVRKFKGTWRVDLFYSAAVFHRNGGISGPNDFKAGSSGAAYGNSSSRIAGHWLIVGLIVVGGIVVATPLLLFVRARRRDRRARAAYASALSQRGRLRAEASGPPGG
jgi:hypothetical protein